MTQLKKYKTVLVSQSTIVVKKYAAVSQRASELIGALKKANVCSRSELIER